MVEVKQQVRKKQVWKPQNSTELEFCDGNCLMKYLKMLSFGKWDQPDKVPNQSL